MGKAIATDVLVMVDGTDLSSFADQIDTPLEKEQVDVSGFGGTKEFLPGVEDATLTVEFLSGFGTAEPHGIVYPLYSSGSQFPVYVVPTSGSITATNPCFGGIGVVYAYNGGAASLNDVGKFSVDFKPAPGYSFTWGTVAPS